MPGRVMGIETEYGLEGVKPDTLIGSYLGIGGGFYKRDFDGIWLPNGARFYDDMGKAEFSTPETSNAVECTAYYEAGKRIVNIARRNLGKRSSESVQICANNSDGKGHSYGCHENMQMKRVPEREYRGRVAGVMIPFLVTRPIFAGAGKVGVEKKGLVLDYAWHRDRFMATFRDLREFFTDHSAEYDRQRALLEEFLELPRRGKGEKDVIFQLSQRADFFESVLGGQTTISRPIFNLRDEPLADPKKYRRMHVIVGDSNMNQVSTYLKMGTLELVVSLVDEGLEPFVRLYDPVQAIKAISRNQTRKWIVETEDSGTISAVDIQRMYLDRAKRRYKGHDEITDDVLKRWEVTLDKLDTDPMSLCRELDWVIKLSRILQLMDEENIGWDNQRVRDLAYAYHLIHDNNLYWMWENRGEVDTLFESEDPIKYAVNNPPNDTRAYARGKTIQLGDPRIESVDWEEIRSDEHRGRMPEPLSTKLRISKRTGGFKRPALYYDMDQP